MTDYYSDAYAYGVLEEPGFDYRDMNGFNGYVDPVLELIEASTELSDDQIFELLGTGREVVAAFTSEDVFQNTYWGIHVQNGISVMGTSSYSIYVADEVGRGTFLDDYMWDGPTHPLLEGVGWYYNPAKWAIAAVTIRDLIGISPQWTADQYNFMTLPWTEVVGPISDAGKPSLLTNYIGLDIG
jgi:hypothetical protein